LYKSSLRIILKDTYENIALVGVLILNTVSAICENDEVIRWAGNIKAFVIKNCTSGIINPLFHDQLSWFNS